MAINSSHLYTSVPRWCTVCEQRIGHSSYPAACDGCLVSLIEPSLASFDTSGDCLTLAVYTEEVRRLILGAKASRSLSYQRTLRDLLYQLPLAKHWCQWADVVVPAPSSLWSRLRGNDDLAHLMATWAVGLGAGKVERPPRHTLWRIHKQSRLRRGAPRFESSGQLCESFGQLTCEPESGKTYPKKILLVDDVLTSGETFFHLKAAVGSGTIRYLALARAIQKTTGEDYDRS